MRNRLSLQKKAFWTNQDGLKFQIDIHPSIKSGGEDKIKHFTELVFVVVFDFLPNAVIVTAASE